MFNGSEINLRKALDDKTPVFGSWIQAASPTCAEILANAGFSWLGIDCEHTSVGLQGVESIARAIHGRNTVLLVRVSRADTIEIRQCLDVGAAGVIVPMVETAAQARTAVAAAKYPPQGVRGYCFGRMNDWGLNFDEYAATANKNVIVIAMIETRAGVDNIDEILSVDGIDGIFIGPYDMSGSYGVPGQTQHPHLKKAYQTLVEACRRHNKAAGQHIVHSTPEKLKEAVSLGYTFICLDADIIMLSQSARTAIDLASKTLGSGGSVLSVQSHCHMKKLLAFFTLMAPLPGPLLGAGASAAAQKSPLYQAPDVLTDPIAMSIVINNAGRTWQGAAPGIARTQGGRLFACLFSGGKREPAPNNYAVFMVSDDDGKTWVDPFAIIDHPHETTRIFDPSLWVDPLGRLWICWNHMHPVPVPKGWREHLYGTWSIRVDNPDIPLDALRSTIAATKPVRIFDGIRINKPVILAGGEWLLPVSHVSRGALHFLVSTNRGETWAARGSVRPPNGAIEPMVVEKKDGVIWLLTRIGNASTGRGVGGGVGQAFSTDGGRTWSAPESGLPRPLIGAGSRLYFGRLPSGALLFITNDNVFLRRKLTAFLSEDDGRTWPWSLVLDDREGILGGYMGGAYLSGPSYPDCDHAPDGRIFAVWDFGRYAEQELRLSIFTETDIKAGAFVSPAARDKLVVSRTGPYLDIREVRTAFPRALALKRGGDLGGLLASLPKKVAVVDEKKRARTITGAWATRNPVPDDSSGEHTSADPARPGEYQVFFIPDKSARLLDTFHLLRATLAVGE